MGDGLHQGLCWFPHVVSHTAGGDITGSKIARIRSLLAFFTGNMVAKLSSSYLIVATDEVVGDCRSCCCERK